MDVGEKIIFAVAPDGQGDGIPIILLGIPRRAWEYMRDGKTHTLDLVKAGVNTKLILYGTDTHETGIEIVKTFLAERGILYSDERDKDFSIKPK